MKYVKFFLSFFIVGTILASCATTQGAADDAYLNNQRTEQIGNRLYVHDIYNGTVILEKDPFTGRYYDVTYGSRYGLGSYRGYPYGSYRIYRNNNRGGAFGRRTIMQQVPSHQQIQQQRGEARKKILGN